MQLHSEVISSLHQELISQEFAIHCTEKSIVIVHHKEVSLQFEYPMESGIQSEFATVCVILRKEIHLQIWGNIQAESEPYQCLIEIPSG